MSTYIFDLQNPDEFLRGSKPFFVERGPFVYKYDQKSAIIEYKLCQLILEKIEQKLICDSMKTKHFLIKNHVNTYSIPHNLYMMKHLVSRQSM